MPQIADWCVVDVLDERGRVERVTAHHRDPAKLELVRRLQSTHQPRVADASGIGEVIRTGSAHLLQRHHP